MLFIVMFNAEFSLYKHVLNQVFSFPIHADNNKNTGGPCY